MRKGPIEWDKVDILQDVSVSHICVPFLAVGTSTPVLTLEDLSSLIPPIALSFVVLTKNPPALYRLIERDAASPFWTRKS
jgi:hypothetical protein